MSSEYSAPIEAILIFRPLAKARWATVESTIECTLESKFTSFRLLPDHLWTSRLDQSQQDDSISNASV
jgi:hypothetical protein